MKAYVGIGHKSQDLSHSYKRKRRVEELTQKQILSCKKVAESLISSVQILLDDRISEDINLRLLQSPGYEDENALARELILTEFKKITKSLKSF